MRLVALYECYIPFLSLNLIIVIVIIMIDESQWTLEITLGLRHYRSLRRTS